MKCSVCGRTVHTGSSIHAACIVVGEDDTKQRRARAEELKDMTARLIEAVMDSPIAKARLGELIQKP